MQTDSPRCTRPIHTALLTIALAACSGSSQTGTALPNPAPAPVPGTANAIPAGITARSESVGAPPSAPAKSSSEAATGPPPPSTREIHGYFTNPTTLNSLRFWRGPNDHKGFERLTRFTVEVDGVPKYSMAVSAIQFAGVCRSPGNGLDQLLLYFHPERRGGGGFGVFRYDTKKRRFTLGFTPRDITQDTGVRVDCSGGRAIFHERAPALPCSCPWRDDPDDPSQWGAASAPAVTTGGAAGGSAAAATADAREILILPEETGGPPFTPRDATGAPARAAGAGEPAEEDEAVEPAIPGEVEAYRAALDAFKAGKTSLESLLAAGDRVREALIQGGEEADPLERLSEEDFAAVRKAMEGFAVGRTEILYVVPDPEPMLSLARAHGDAADVAYFENLTRTTNGVWPVYIEQMTDYGGCTKYGSQDVVAAYRRWTEFARRFPGRYTEQVKSEIAGATKELTGGTCACGGSETALQEMTAFVKEFPTAPIAADVRRQIEAIKGGTSKLRFNCEPR